MQSADDLAAASLPVDHAFMFQLSMAQSCNFLASLLSMEVWSSSCSSTSELQERLLLVRCFALVNC